MTAPVKRGKERELPAQEETQCSKESHLERERGEEETQDPGGESTLR